MRSESCAVCSRKIGLFKTKIKDGYICGGCLGKIPASVYEKKEDYTGSQIAEITSGFEARVDTYANGHYGSKPAPKADEEDPFVLIKKYKELLDAGVITQEEFNRKKSELIKL